MPRITEMFAFIAEDEGPGDEGVIAHNVPGRAWGTVVHLPLVGADMARVLPRLKHYCGQVFLMALNRPLDAEREALLRELARELARRWNSFPALVAALENSLNVLTAVEAAGYCGLPLVERCRAALAAAKE